MLQAQNYYVLFDVEAWVLFGDQLSTLLVLPRFWVAAARCGLSLRLLTYQYLLFFTPCRKPLAVEFAFKLLIWQQSLKARQFESSGKSLTGTMKRELLHQEKKSQPNLVIPSQFVSRKAIIMDCRVLMEATIQTTSTKMSLSLLKANVCFMISLRGI